MEIYLPIAELPINIFVILLIGLFAGGLSGVFGIGGGFIMTPLLIFMGIPPAVSVATSANQIVASSFSAFLAHMRRNNVDFKMGMILIIGGFIGSSIGVWIFNILQEFGQIDLVISLCYIVILGSIGFSMGIESYKAIINAKKNIKIEKKKDSFRDRFFAKLPFKTEFPKSKIRISVLVPIIVSLFSGVLVSIMGIGGGFIMIPAMIYIFGMPTSIVIGTSLFQVIFVTANVTILHSVTTHTVDIILATILLTSSVIGAQLGTRIGAVIPAEKLRAILALMILAMVFKLILGFITTPISPFEILPIN